MSEEAAVERPEADSRSTSNETHEITQRRTLESGKRVRRMSVNLDEDLHRQLRREALEADKSLTAYVTDILEQRH